MLWQRPFLLSGKKYIFSESFFHFVSKNFINFRKRKDFIHTVVIFVVYSIRQMKELQTRHLHRYHDGDHGIS